MRQWLHRNQMLLFTATLTFGYLVIGYGAFVDGKLLFPISKVELQSSPYSKSIQCGDSCRLTHITTKDRYKKGELVEANLKIEKFRAISGTIQWNLMDARYYPYVPKQVSLPVGKLDIRIPIEKVPTHIPPGVYYFTGLVKYDPNPLGDVFQAVRTNCFIVEDEIIEDSNGNRG